MVGVKVKTRLVRAPVIGFEELMVRSVKLEIDCIRRVIPS
jgi:hypothetical protein